MKLLKGGDLGAFVKAICAYMFRGEEVQFKDKEIQGYYNLCKLKMDISKKRKSCGSRGGKAKCGVTKIKATGRCRKRTSNLLHTQKYAADNVR